jgi:hypothetical protein
LYAKKCNILTILCIVHALHTLLCNSLCSCRFYAEPQNLCTVHPKVHLMHVFCVCLFTQIYANYATLKYLCRLYTWHSAQVDSRAGCGTPARALWPRRRGPTAQARHNTQAPDSSSESKSAAGGLLASHCVQLERPGRSRRRHLDKVPNGLAAAAADPGPDSEPESSSTWLLSGPPQFQV